LLQGRFIEAITETVGRENILLDPVDLTVYGTDASTFYSKPAIIVFPPTAEAAARALKLANDYDVPVVPRGAGTGLTGGAVPYKEDSMILASTRNDRILELDLSSFIVSVEPGIVLGNLNKFLSKHGLFIPVEPASDSVCTVGGNVSTNAVGLRGLKYGSFRESVAYLDVATMEGEILRVGSTTRKMASGYDLLDLFIGSEGTLGYVTRVGLRLEKIPRHRVAVSGAFDDHQRVVKAALEVLARGLKPSIMEFMDKFTVRAVSQYLEKDDLLGYDILILEFEGYTKGETMTQSRIAERVIEGFGGRAKLWDSNSEIWDFRKACLPALTAVKPKVTLFDLALPLGKLEDGLQEVYRISGDMKLDIGVFGHLGDGIYHPCLLMDPFSQEGEKLDDALKALSELAVEFGGSLSGEHGIGLEKKPYFAMEHPKTNIELMKRWKRILDPKGLMNPGKIWEE
jgi:glycolate oxidase